MSNATTTPSRQIDRVDYIQNIGRFESVRGNKDTAFQPLSLIYSQNGRGKTTLCAILRSLTTGDPAPILERRRLSATTEAKAVVSIGGSEVAFDGKGWSAPGPRIAIYDDHFVDANVHSGLSVDAGHRKGVHELVVGEQGVRLQRQIQDLNTKISSLQAKLRNAEHKVLAAALGRYSVDEFCALQPVENLEREVKVAEQSLSLLRNTEEVRTKEEFRPFALPSFDEGELASLLATTLPDVDAATLRTVVRHVSGLGAGGEGWISRGLHYLDDSEDCPFCGNRVSETALVSHYRAYFSESYAAHKRRIQELRNRLASGLSGDCLADFQRVLQQERDKREFWARYFESAAFGLDLEHLATAWNGLRHHLLGALDKKGAAPLEPVLFNQSARDAMDRYRDVAETVRTISTSLVGQNSSVWQAKEHATQGSVAASQAQLERLQAIQRRLQPEVDAACKDYLAAKENKTEAEKEKANFRAELDEHRNSVFGASETAINRFLVTFNADFTLDKLRPSDPRGVPSSSYDVRVNDHPVALKASSTPGPSFRTTLSAGDRNTLALAFFFASLEQLNLRDTVVVIDDPISSLDDARSFATAQEIRKLEGQCQQLIVLSHSRSLLCQLWERAHKDTTATLEIRDAGTDSSTLAPWDIEAAAVTEFDRLHLLVRNYVEAAQGDPQKVAPALRILLESFLRVAFVRHFKPGSLLGSFLQRARGALADGSPILPTEAIQELDDLREYANRFHHSTNRRGWIDALANVNDRELRGYAQRVLRFTTLDGRVDGR